MIKANDLKFVQVNLHAVDAQKYTNEFVNFSDMLLRVESTNHCNFKCNFCPHPSMQRQKGFMNEELFCKIIDEASSLGFRKLDLRNFGEPILDKRISRFAKYSKERGVDHIYIHTNGYGISEKIVNDWGSSGIIDANISLSPKREFSQTRPGSNVDRLFRDIENVMKSNSDWKHILSVDYIKTGKSSEEEEKEFMNWLTDIGIPKRIEVELHNWAKGSTSTYTQCHRLWSSVTVLFDGRVCLCCLDYEGEIELGNLNDQSLKDVLNSELYRTIRKNHIEGKFLEKCASCDMPMVKDLGEVATFSKIDLK